ncbi:large conductance mechanosensitive channel protein MscL [Candidatus Kaiserbacteria bacterium]|nr:large conductance mechanosensitive channel protein MscL [Candidatus Kaiserbacteria bacterium]
MLKGFRDFILRGNVVDLAVGVMIGASFGAVVTTLVKGILTPLISALFSQPDFSKLSFTIHGSQILYGDFLNATASFLITATVIYFIVVTPLNELMLAFKGPVVPEDPTTKECPECLSKIPKKAKRCAFCTAQLT